MNSRSYDILKTLLRAEERDIPLFETALRFSAHRYPDMDARRYLDMVDGFRQQFIEVAEGVSSNADKLLVLNRYFFETLQFQPNSENYFDPKNSCLSDVIESRKGIPITLSLLYIEIGKSAGLNLSGVCFPGHFLIRYQDELGHALLDAFGFGRSLSMRELQDLLKKFGYQEVSPSVIQSLVSKSPTKAILSRLLLNLKAIYLRDQDYDKALSIINWIIEVGLIQPTEYRDRGLVEQQLGLYQSALKDYETYLQLAGEVTDLEDIQQRIIDLSRLRSNLH